MGNELVTVNGRPATRYIEAILFVLVNWNEKQIKNEDVEKVLLSAKVPFRRRQVHYGLSNFHKTGLIRRIGKGSYDIEAKKVRAFVDRYLKGQEAIWCKKQGPAPKKVDPPPKGKKRPIDIIRAIFCAYNKPLTLNDVVVIAKRYNLAIKQHNLRWYQHQKKDELILDEIKRGKAYSYRASPIFYKRHAKDVNRFISILPHKEKEILTHLNEYARDQVKAIQKDIQIEPAGDPKPQVDQIEPAGDPETVDVANVGASIIAYIHRLKTELKTLTAAGLNTAAVQDLQEKNSRLSAALTGLTSERNQLQFEVSKLEKIVADKESRLLEKDKQIQEIEHKLSLHGHHIPKTFTVGEVARITQVIKADRRR
jgi:hypothetical protein